MMKTLFYFETLLEILGPSYTHAELLSGGNRLAINDEGLAVAKI